MKCPNCNTKLKEIELEQVQVDYCESCEGIFYDKDELQKVLSSTLDASYKEFEQFLQLSHHDQKSDYKNKICPKDLTLMVNIEYPKNSNIHVDFCKTCHGLWTDKEETEKIIQHLIKKENSDTANQKVQDNNKQSTKKTPWRMDLVIEGVLSLLFEL